MAARRLIAAARHGLAGLGLIFLLTIVTPVTFWWSRLLAGPWNDPRGEILLVPGADIQAPGILGYTSYLRCEYAALAWKEGGLEQVILTGGPGGSGGPAVSALMRNLLVSLGVPASRITIEEGSASTRENALAALPLLAAWPGRRVILLTSDLHMYRALRTFRRVGIVCQPRPFPDAGKRASTWWQRPAVLVGLGEESAKIAYYRWRGWL